MRTVRSNTALLQGNSDTQGSALIVSIIFTTILAVIAIPSYLSLSNQTLRQSNRSFYNGAAINAAESGIEYAVQAVMLQSENNYSWNNWSISGNDAYITMDDFTLVGDIHASTNVYIYNYADENPEVVVKSTIHLPTGAPVEKYMYASLSASSTRGLFAYGALTKEFIQASGGVAFDSWISDPDNDPSTDYVPYSDSVARDDVTIATVGTDAGAITLGSSDVYGSAAIGSSDYSGLDVGWGGQVGPRDESEWDPADTDELWKKDGWLVSTQTGALSTSFTADFEEIVAPEVETTELWTSYELPYTDKRTVSNQWSSWTQNVYVDEESIGSSGTETVLNMDELIVKGGATLTIEGDVTIILPNENTTSLQVIEGGALKLADDATLTIYIAGDIEVSGAGIFSEVAPQQLQIWGTATDSQSIDFLGSGQLSGIIYAPNAEVKINGDADLYGSIVCKNMTLTGSGSFRYDESLANYTGDTSNPGPTTVDYVEELVGTERDPYIDDLVF
jgi:hypothetical protein